MRLRLSLGSKFRLQATGFEVWELSEGIGRCDFGFGAAALVVTVPWALRLRPGGPFCGFAGELPTKGSNDLLHSMTILILPLLRLVCLP